MPEIRGVGSHSTWFEEPDLIGLRLSGHVSSLESEALAREHLGMAQGRDVVFMLVDMAGYGSGTPAGRKMTSEALYRMPVRGIALYNAKLISKVMAKLVFAGVKLFRKDREGLPIEFFADEAEARAWIEAKRGATGRV